MSGKAQTLFQASADLALANIPLAEVSHISRPRIEGRGAAKLPGKECGYREG